MLGLTKLYAGSNSRILVWFIITLTLVELFTLFDAYFFQSTKSFISPLQRNDIQNCDMTYSYPKYIEIDNVDSTFSLKYRLFIYRDGYRDSDTVKKNILS